MKILVCGASGILGREICQMLERYNIDFIGTYNNNVVNLPNYLKFNINEIDQIIENHKPDIIINCIVNRNVDDCETKWDSIRSTNIDLTNKLASYQIKVIHISSDYVFDGSNPPYTPLSMPNPLQNYGISKYISELRILNKSNEHLIIRVPVLFTDKYQHLNENAVTILGKNIMDLTLNTFNEDAVCIRRPVYIPILCEFIHNCIISNYSGVYHFYNPVDRCTKYDMSIKIANILGKHYNHINPIYDAKNRPLDTELIDDKYNIQQYYNNYDLDNILRACFSRYSHPKAFHNCFLMIDLDGTLVNSEEQNYESYNQVIGISRDEFYSKLQTNDLELSEEDKKVKNTIFADKIKSINFIDGADKFIQYLLQNDVNFVIVTNTSQQNVDLYKEHLPLLNNIKNWVVRDQYKMKKPYPDCYNLALDNFYKNETHIVGIENTAAGYNALKNVTDIIYLYVDDNKHFFKNLDAYLFNRYDKLF
jgi:HAD superfamily hydrolase (TIGR01509 family)